jgi:hypothetical protein
MSFNGSLGVLLDTTSINDLGAIEEDLSTMYVISQSLEDQSNCHNLHASYPSSYATIVSFPVQSISIRSRPMANTSARDPSLSLSGSLVSQF